MKTTRNFNPTLLNRASQIGALLCMFGVFDLSAQTLKMQFTFGDTGTTTTDSVSSVVLNLTTNNLPTDLHGAAGTGPAGQGKCLNLTAGTYTLTTAPLASTVGNTTVNFGTVSNFTVTMWLKARSDSPQFAGSYFARYFILGTNGVNDVKQNNQIAFMNGATSYSFPTVNAFIGTNSNWVEKDFAVTNPPVTTNLWTFVAMTYNGTNVSYYSGSESQSVSAQVLQFPTTLTNATVNLGSSFSLFLGNKGDASRVFQGSMADVRFYTGAASSNYLETVRTSALPPAPTGLSVSGCGLALLSWNPVTGATNYIIKRSGSSGTETNYASTNGVSFMDTAVTLGNTYYYTVSAISSSGVSSPNATEASLFIGAPVVYTQPANQIVSVGWQAAFSIQAGGGQTYQWRRGGINLTNSANVSGATNAVLTLNGLGLTDSGATFDCVVGNGCGSVTNITPATLTVVTNTLQLHFAFEDSGTTTTDSVAGVALGLVDASGSAANLHGAAGTGVGGVGQALDMSAASQGGSGPLASVVGNTAINFGAVSSFTVSLWVKPTSTLYNYFSRFFILGTNGVTDNNQANSLAFQDDGGFQASTAMQGWVGLNSASATAFGAVDMPVGQWTYLVLTYNGATINLYSGSQTNSVTLKSTQSLTAGTVQLGSSWNLLLGNRNAKDRAFQGLLDDVRFYLGAAPTNFLENVRIAGGGTGSVVVTTNDSPAIKVSTGSGQLVMQATNTVNGALYILESTPSLAPASWTPVSTNIGTGGPLTNQVTLLPGATNQFFRYQVTAP